MAERSVDDRTGAHDGSPPPADDVPSASRGGMLARFASAGRWMGEPNRARGWEDYLSDFLSALLVWGGIGWLLDRWLDTAPWLLIAGIVLGNTLGIYLLWLHGERSAAQDARDREARSAAARERRTHDDLRGGRS